MIWCLALLLTLAGCTAAVNYTPQYDPQVVKVLTLNFGGAASGNVQARLNQVADLVAREGVDIVCLQEAPGGPVSSLLHGVDNGVGTLAGQVGHRFCSSVTWTEGFGSAVLEYRTGITSRFKMTGCRDLALSHDKGATVADCGGVKVASVHFSAEAPEAHLKAVVALMGAGPAIIAGDTNASAPALSEAATAAGFTEAPLPPGATSVDRMFVRGLEVVGAKTVLTEVSDHNGLLVTLRYLP